MRGCVTGFPCYHRHSRARSSDAIELVGGANLIMIMIGIGNGAGIGVGKGVRAWTTDEQLINRGEVRE